MSENKEKIENEEYKEESTEDLTEDLTEDMTEVKEEMTVDDAIELLEKEDSFTQYGKDELISFRRSEDLTQLISALIGFHSEFQDVEKSEENPFFNSKYADLSSILKVARPILSKHDLILMQFPISGHKGKGKSIAIKTILFHKSGQFIESDGVDFVPNQYDIQKIGGIETYIRRYGVQALLMVSFKCEDDDGNEEANATPKIKTKSTSKTKASRL